MTELREQIDRIPCPECRARGCNGKYVPVGKGGCADAALCDCGCHDTLIEKLMDKMKRELEYLLLQMYPQTSFITRLRDNPEWDAFWDKPELHAGILALIKQEKVQPLIEQAVQQGDEELREKMAKKLEAIWYSHDLPDIWNLMADRIFTLIKQAGYVKLSPDQSLPEPSVETMSYENAAKNINCWVQRVSYSLGLQDMLRDGWRKVKL